jgi:hypothetical protein
MTLSQFENGYWYADGATSYDAAYVNPRVAAGPGARKPIRTSAVNRNLVQEYIPLKQREAEDRDIHECDRAPERPPRS